MMDILKIVETLQSFSEDVVAYKLGGEFSLAVTDAINLLIEQGECIADLDTPRGGWIPVSLGFLPEQGQEVIVCDGGEVFSYRFWDKNYDSFKHITHWMSMPEPPGEFKR